MSKKHGFFFFNIRTPLPDHVYVSQHALASTIIDISALCNKVSSILFVRD